MVAVGTFEPARPKASHAALVLELDKLADAKHVAGV
jgi:hypothetical protein